MCGRALGLVLLVASTIRPQGVENFDYPSWKAFKPGDWVLWKEDVGARALATEARVRLLEVTPEIVRIEIARVKKAGGRHQTSLETQELRLDPGDRVPWHHLATLTGKGSESVEIDGRSVSCSWKEMEDKNEGRRIRMWTSPEIPGGLARTVEQNGAMETENVVLRWSRAGIPPSAAEKALNDKARETLAGGADIELKETSILQSCRKLSEALGIQVFKDARSYGGSRRIDLRLTKGESVEKALTAALRSADLTWVLHGGALIITNTSESAILERNDGISLPPDEFLARLHPTLWAKREVSVELKSSMTVGEAIQAVGAALDTTLTPEDIQNRVAEPLGWSATRPALLQLRLLARSLGCQIQIDGSSAAFKTDGVVLGLNAQAIGVDALVRAAISKLAQNKTDSYKSTIQLLKKRKNLARDALEGILDQPKTDRKLVLRVLKDLD